MYVFIRYGINTYVFIRNGIYFSAFMKHDSLN